MFDVSACLSPEALEDEPTRLTWRCTKCRTNFHGTPPAHLLDTRDRWRRGRCSSCGRITVMERLGPDATSNATASLAADGRLEESEDEMTSHRTPVVRKAMKAADVRFFWTEGGERDDLYHWCVDCPWISVAIWHGARLYSSEMPPGDAEAKNVTFVREFLEEHLQGPAWSTSVSRGPGAAHETERWLCEVCSQYVPRPVAVAIPAEDEPCAKCGCDQEIHIRCRGPFDTGCGMAWVDQSYGCDPEPDCIGLIHCPCDGYEPLPGGLPLTPADFATK